VQTGAGIIVVGSGGARRVPDGMDEERAMLQFKHFLGQCAQAGARHNIVFAIEPLNHTETNFINTVHAGAELVRAVGDAHVRLLVDSYHMDVESEPMDDVVRAHGLIAHAHTADTRRVAPGSGSFDHRAFLRALRIAGYRGRLSIECHWTDMATELAPSLNHLRALSPAPAR
jgi:sugar phosphate isomerase/epimerase